MSKGGKPIVFWGASGHARVLRELTASLGYELIALFDNDPNCDSPFDDVPLFIGETGFLAWRKETKRKALVEGLATIGGVRGGDRLKLMQFMGSHGIRLATVVHRSAFVAADATLGEGSQILAQAAVCASASIGRGCIVNTAASVDHESVLEDGVHLAPGATLCGCVRVGARSLIGPGAVVLPRIRIGSDAVVGAGAVVTRDVPDSMVVYGNPARVIRKNIP